MKIRVIICLFCLTLFLLPSNSFAAAGDLDRSYGNNGLALFGDMDASGVIAVQADNKVIAGGQCYVAGLGSHFCLKRYTASGALDTGFGVTGKVFTPVSIPTGSEASIVTKIIVLPDGRILAFGYTERHVSSPGEGHFYQFAIARYNPDGTLDPTFDGDGLVVNKITTGTPGAKLHDGLVQPDGKIVAVGGGGYGGGNDQHVVARFNFDGSFDTSFNGNGKVLTDGWGATGDGWLAAVALQPDGNILVGGRGGVFFRNVLLRYTSVGIPDTSFGDSGKVIYSGPGFNANNFMRKIHVYPDGTILVLSTSFDGPWPTVFLAKFNSNGSFDTTFDGDGKLSTDLGPEQDCDATDFHIQAGGKILLGANCSISSSTFAGHAAVSARFHPNGTVDTQYGNKGYLYRIQPGFNDTIAVQSNGKIIFGGVYSPSVNVYQFFLTRYLNNGTREADFDNDRKSDISVFRPSTGVWYLFNTTGVSVQQFGSSGDRITPGDYDGDGKIDIAVFRQGAWYISRSSDNTVAGINFGLAGDEPVAADYDGDGRSDIAVFRQGVWYITNSSNGSVNIAVFGQAGDKPVVGNFDGDLRSDLGIYRNGVWYTYNTAGVNITSFGLGTDKPVAADYDSDGKTDLAVYRDGVWYILGSHAGFFGYYFGIATDKPAPADYDGDGRGDPAVYRDGTWYIQNSSAGLTVSTFGTTGDIPVPSAYLP